MRIVLAALLWLSFAGAASSHALWLEPGEGGYQLYFGEFGENLREGSPGLLDRFEPMPAAKAFGASGDVALKAEKKPTSFQFSGVPEGTGSVVAEQARVTERKPVDKAIRTLDRYSARYIADFGERKPLIPLDIVPAGKPGSFKVFYDGKPLPGARAEIVTEFGWTRELKTDEAGAFEVALPWKGTYAIEVSLADNTPGTHGTAPYDGMRFVTTLTFRVPDGLAAPARPPTVTPKR
ncbi:DUF4198 domain-containing protein [Reyranella sp.]|uniref:DUF4198 domain-containing protein n=1 Tax=Reyranella sp. TaxID=1929291 RepID=UPI00271F7850|nr:DUF4198 domain-containing protein [Reyranella sp.]MDO8973057.1 DUF4198 domain-containing protein [Reyranella sp.]MDP3241345.1 DUF4198 domain-containing protein [Reyranella sp.]